MEIPLSFSMSIQSDFANCPDPRPFTVPALVMALPNSRTFSVMVVLPASGCEIIAKGGERLCQTPLAAGSQMILWSCAWMRTFWRFRSFMKSTMSDILILPNTGLRNT